MILNGGKDIKEDKEEYCDEPMVQQISASI